uniref:AB hydrolase-1 domain-containing protein n=1 Tax=Helicotheca tamesis TaxID=374047 RepID=A0A7S2I5I0_9STRA|mmetsp:Transcript_5681/g.7803  ORF Transcript_5681/g.7803 Transcript_5681/m.7803 type:complete len:216 (+) Transcript_5681:73-720(+)
MRVVILPGNGCTNVRQANWYGWLEQRFKTDAATRFSAENIILRDMPDPHRARRSKWLPFIRSEMLGCSKDDANDHGKGPETIIVGHSSGAEAAMRLAETTHVAGLVLVAACHTDLGEPNETQSGWYPPGGGPWLWDNIRANAGSGLGCDVGNIIMLHSLDDPFIPIVEPRHVAGCLGQGTELREFENESHFFHPSEEIVKAVYDVADRALSKDLN